MFGLITWSINVSGVTAAGVVPGAAQNRAPRARATPDCVRSASKTSWTPLSARGRPRRGDLPRGAITA